ncbi:MAG: hypothetical protein RIE24_02880, partial [Silicimonas sp.]
VIFQRELIKQRRLRFLSRSQHSTIPRLIQELNQQFTRRSSKSFSTKYADHVECLDKQSL